ncbi:protein kinase domain-containing protein [Aliiglaciecola lipolytica]|uniref:non-specific serine/threonine protein kinase n=1 Tax=Aliiglaciecola lipolytica E3 TaxID=1127673 RepID=K6YHP4_9ALTE|nr:protein kinase [Aliiglaciecola lipolytica]GAC16143.1 BR serine/threonine kinase [Aliiglaciecola lipolytica E3]
MTDRTSHNSNDLDTQAFVAAPEIKEGRILAKRFKVLKSIGNGAQADVYLTYDELLETEIAIKVVESSAQDPQSLNSIRNEVLLARKLQHPNIIRIFDVYEDSGLIFFTMEFIEGEPLFKRITQPISKSLYQDWSIQLFNALIACQSAGIKHGDIKPDNIIIDSNNQLRLIDFGIGQIDGKQEQTSGHKEYSAPEVIHTGQSSPTSEAYSAGKVLDVMLKAVTFEKNNAMSAKWKRKQQSLIAKLTHPHPDSRPTLNLVIESLSENNSSYQVSKKGLFIAISIMTVVILLAVRIMLPDRPTLPNKVVQLAVVNDGTSELLSQLSQLLALPLQTEPKLALNSINHTQNAIENLSLQPSTNANDRVELATLLNLDAMILLNIANIDGNNFLVRASIFTYPEDFSLFEITQTVNANTLGQDLKEFSQKIQSQLFSYIDNTSTPSNENNSIAGNFFLSAESAFNNYDVENTEKNLESLFNLATKSQYWTLKGRLLQAELNEDLALAQQSIAKLVELYPNRADLLAKRADIYQWSDQNDLAINDYQAALTISPSNGQLWFELARLKIITGQTQSAISNELTKALVTFRQTGDKAGEGLVLNAFGVAHLRLSEYDAAQRYFQDSLAIRNAEDFPLDRANTLANFANTAAINGQFDIAKESLEEASLLLKKEGDIGEQAHVLDTLGFLHEEQGLYYDALKYYKAGLDLRVSQSSSIEQAESMSNVAYMHFLTGEFSLADIYWQQANSLFSKSNELSHLLRTWQNLAQLSLAKGDDLAARRYLQQVSQKIDSAHQQELMINNLLFSYYHFANANLQSAMDKIDEAKQIAMQTDDSRALTEIHLWQGEVCLRIVDTACLEEQLSYASEMISSTMLEQHAVLIWLQFALNVIKSDLAPSAPEQFLSQLDQVKIPAMTEMKILLDIQERLKLPLDSKIMTRLNEMVKPIFYQQYMDLLFIQAVDADSKRSLQQQLVSHPNYWRNHLYYTRLEGDQFQQKQQELQSEWLSQLNEQQADAYREHYLE